MKAVNTSLAYFYNKAEKRVGYVFRDRYFSEPIKTEGQLCQWVRPQWHKKLKGLRKESLRDNMTDIEVLLTDLGEIATRDIAQSEHPQGFNENMNVAKRGGQVANDARKSYEKQTKKSAISKDNALNYKYVDNEKLIEDKKNKKKK